MHVVERRLAGPDAVPDVGEGLHVRLHGEEQLAQRQRVVAAHQLGHRRERERLRFHLREDALRGEGPQDPVQGAGVRTGLAGEVLDGARPVDEPVGDAQVGRHPDGERDDDVGQLEQAQDGRLVDVQPVEGLGWARHDAASLTLIGTGRGNGGAWTAAGR